MKTDGAIAQFFKKSDQCRHPLTCQTPIRVEAMDAELIVGNTGKKCKFSSHGVGPPGRHLQLTMNDGTLPEIVKVAKQSRGNLCNPATRVKKRFALDYNQVGQYFLWLVRCGGKAGCLPPLPGLTFD